MGAEGPAELFSFRTNPPDQLGEFLSIGLGRLELVGEPFHSIQSYRNLVGMGRKWHATVSITTGYLSPATIDELANLADDRVPAAFGAGWQNRSSRDERP
ncbi:MAG TPA: hypothetical protein VG222_16735 [Vicinamibacterales bacterium]|nr:hypothetical protein [Vicinamibacterales bacterium]